MSLMQQTSEQLELHLVLEKEELCSEYPKWGAERLVAECKTERLDESTNLIEQVVERSNLKEALRQVVKNKGCPGVDDMSVKELPAYLVDQWPRIKEELLAGRYGPSAVKVVRIPKASGGERTLGIPTVVDRFIQQSILQVLQKEWDRTFSEHSYGFRPGKSAHQSIAQMQAYVKQGKRWVVDIDLEKFFDRVNHDKLMGLIAKRVEDKRMLKLIRCYLESGSMEGGLYSETKEGTPQGGPLSPLLSNLMLDVLDKELERRGHYFVRYADDCNIYVGSKEAGTRVMSSVKKFLESRLKLKVNQQKSAVGRPWKRKFLGYTVLAMFGKVRRKIAPESIKRFKSRIRKITNKTRGIRIEKMISEMKEYLEGWMGYYRYTQIISIFKELDKWIRRRLRVVMWKQWGRRGYRELVKRGISRRLAWDTSKSAHGPWRLCHSPAIEIALPVTYFNTMGLPQLRNLV